MEKASLVWSPGTPLREYQNNRLKTCACVVVTATWNNYYLTQTLVTPTAPYHFVFDSNGTMKTGAITWSKTDGTVKVTAGASDVYFIGVSLYVV